MDFTALRYLYNNIKPTSDLFLVSRLIDTYLKNDQIIIAYDFDDTVRPFYGTDCNEVVELLKRAKAVLNPYFILYTSNADIEYIKKYIKENDIPCNSINENAEFINFDKFGKKLYYNIFLDDKCGLRAAMDALETLINLVEKGLIKKSAETNELIKYFLDKINDKEFDYSYNDFSTAVYTFNKDEIETLKYWADMYKKELYLKTGGLVTFDDNLYHKLNCIVKNNWNEFLQEGE